MTDPIFLKQVTDRSLPDLAAVRQAVLDGAVSPAPRRQVARRLVPVLAFAVVLAIGLAWLPRMTTSHPGGGVPAQGGPQPGGVTAPILAPAEEDRETVQPAVQEPEDVVHIAELDETGAATSPAKDFGYPEGHFIEELTLSQVLDSLGWDPRPTALPQGLVPNPDERHARVRAADGSLLRDQQTFSYEEDFVSTDYNPLEKRLQITVSKGLPIRGCAVYAFPDEMLASTIGGVSMKLAHRSIGYGPYTVVENGPNIPAGYYHMFVAEFEMNGAQVQVVTENLSQVEYLAALRSMVDGD